MKTGALVESIADVNTALVGGEPSGWVTQSGAGLHLVATYELDALGRATTVTEKVTDTHSNITYVDYNDPNHEVRIYQGWNTTTDLPTGPITVLREDRGRSYTEVLTMSAVPTVVGGRPTGDETIASLQSATRTHFNDAGQPVNNDEYFSFTGAAYTSLASWGTPSTHFNRTSIDYDQRGRVHRVVRGDGTIYRTVFDGLAAR